MALLLASLGIVIVALTHPRDDRHASFLLVMLFLFGVGFVLSLGLISKDW